MVLVVQADKVEALLACMGKKAEWVRVLAAATGSMHVQVRSSHTPLLCFFLLTSV